MVKEHANESMPMKSISYELNINTEKTEKRNQEGFAFCLLISKEHHQNQLQNWYQFLEFSMLKQQDQILLIFPNSKNRVLD